MPFTWKTVLYAAVLIGMVIVIGGVSIQMTSLNAQLKASQENYAQAAATQQVNESQLAYSQFQLNALATRVAEQQVQLQDNRQPEAKYRTETILLKSDYDGKVDSYLLITPEPPSTAKRPLVVFFHSLGNGPDEILKLKAGDESLVSFLARRDLIVASPTYRGDSWLNPAALSDVTQMLRILKARYSPPAIVLSGVSMGGSAALMYTLLAPRDIGISGTVAAVFASDMSDLWSETKSTQVKDSLRIAYGGAPAEQSKVYAERSLSRNVANLPAGMPFALYASYSDSMIPITQQLRLRDALAARGNPLLFVQIPGDHRVEGLGEGFLFVLSRLPAK